MSKQGNSKLAALALGLQLPLFANAAYAASAAVCHDLTIPVSATAQASQIILPSLDLTNANFVSDLVENILGNAGRLWPIIPVEGDYNISATYCAPQDALKVDTVQLLVHGATYTKSYWTGLNLPEAAGEKYSWAEYAAKEGYATLSIDRLGAGQSTHPDPLLQDQVNMAVEITHQLVEMLRKGEIMGKAFSKVIYVGHSVGSMIGSACTQRHPADFDLTILTGWSGNFLENFPKILTTIVLPAPLVIPKRLGHLSPLYLTTTLEAAMKKVFYGPEGSYDEAVADWDFKHRDAIGTGELLSMFSGENTSPTYDRPVQVIVGEQDNVFCSPLGKCSPGSKGTPGNAARMFPSSSNYTSQIIPETGHDLNLHYSAQETFKVAHNFIRDNLP